MLILSIAGLAIVFALVVLFVLSKLEAAGKQRSVRIKLGGITRNSSKKSKLEDLFKKPLIGGYLRWVRSQLFLSGHTAEENLRMKSVLLGFGSVISSLITFIILIKLYHANLFITLSFGFACVYLNGIIIRSFIGNSDTKLLNSLVDYIGDVKHFYHATGMVDEAIKQANLRAKAEMLNQGTKIYNIITGVSPELFLRDYYDRCSNKFLKIFAGFSHLVNDYGDKKVDGVSLYIKNLNYITEEIQIEIIKKNQLAYWLKGLNVIVLFPLFLPPIIESWVKSSFPAVSSFYVSAAGFYVKCFIFLAVVVCYVFIVQIQKTEYKAKPRQKKTWDYYLNKIGFISAVVNIFKPKNNSLKYRKMKSFLEDDAGTNITVEGLYLRRILYGVIAFTVVLGIFWSGHKTNIEKIMSDAAYGIKNPNFFRMMGKMDPEYEKKNTSINETDSAVIENIKRLNLKSKDEYKTAVKDELVRMSYKGEDPDIVSDRIYAKIVSTGKEYIRLWELFVSLMLSIIASYFPLAVLAFNASLRKVDMEDEVFQFHTIIILLMHHDNVDVKVVLEWMKEFANIFKTPIELCLTNFQNQNMALEKLKDDVKFKPFVKLIENLQMANDDINLKSAFDALELERDFYKENRKENNRQQVNKKIEFGQMIGFIPVHSVLLLYMALPIIVTSFSAFKDIQKQLM